MSRRPTSRAVNVWIMFATALALVACDPKPGDAPRPSDPDHTTPKPKTMPDTKAPDGLPASQPSY
jgi:hypothetical protein